MLAAAWLVKHHSGMLEVVSLRPGAVLYPQTYRMESIFQGPHLQSALGVLLLTLGHAFKRWQVGVDMLSVLNAQPVPFS